jgi:chromosome segregation ATPase
MNAELQQTVKRHLAAAKDLQQQLDDSEREKEAIKEAANSLERKANALANEAEEARCYCQYLGQ